jgi:multiple sugar transport system substrate-binding protein
VQADEDVFRANCAKFTKETGVEVKVDFVGWEDINQQTAVTSNSGAGPDIIIGFSDAPHIYVDKLVELTDVADYLGKKYGGWVQSAVTYGKSGNKWIDIPLCFNGNMMNYRVSALKKAGFSKFPATTDELLEYAKATKRNNTPGGMALGHATGDGNAWAYWCLWAHGGNLVDKNDKVILNSPETVKSLEYAKQLYDNMIPGVAAWNDAFNNKAFLAGEISWTNNGISIYAAAKRDPTKKEIAEDMDHALWPVGPVGKPTEFHVCFPMLAMSYTKYPQACKALMAFLLEADNYNKWLEASVGYLTHPLNAYDANPVWTSDPKNTIFREAAKRTLTAGGLGSVGEKAAAALADFIIVDMFANVCAGREDAKAAVKIAERQAMRLYR